MREEPGHETGTRVGRWQERLICDECGDIATPIHALGAYVGGPVNGRYPDHPEGPIFHFWPFMADGKVVPMPGDDPVAILRADFGKYPAPDATEEPEDIIVKPEAYRMCRGGDEDGEQCSHWAHDCPDHSTEATEAYKSRQRAAWREERGLTTPREEMPSRQDRSDEYAKRNEARRRERALARS